MGDTHEEGAVMGRVMVTETLRVVVVEGRENAGGGTGGVETRVMVGRVEDLERSQVVVQMVEAKRGRWAGVAEEVVSIRLRLLPREQRPCTL